MHVAARYIVKKSRPDQIRSAFQQMLKLCEEEEITQVTLVVPKKGGWEHSDVAKVMERDIAKALLRGQQVFLTDGVGMTLESGETFSPLASREGLLVGAHISIAAMDKLDDSSGAHAIMYLPWSEEEGKEWQATWNPQIVGAETQNVAAGKLPEAVEKALNELTQSINLGTKVWSDPSDKQHAEETIDRLLAEEHSLDPVEVGRWARRNGWTSRAAANLEAVVRKRR
jgi:hypothetical protein